MTKTIRTCDVCGNEIPGAVLVVQGSPEPVSVSITFPSNPLVGDNERFNIDICADCVRDFQKFVKQRRKGNEK